MTHGTAIEDPQHEADLYPSSSTSLQKAAATPHEMPNTTIMELIKDDFGFGFNVVGGKDSEHIPGDTGIFVTSIRDDGAAQRDGRIKVGDKILQVDDSDITCVTHDEAVRVLRSIKEKAVFHVLHNAEILALQNLRRPLSASPCPTSEERTKLNGIFSPTTAKIPEETPEPPPMAKIVLSLAALKKKEEDEESIYAPSTHSIIDDVPRSPPRKKKSVYEHATPYITEAIYVGLGLAAISLTLFVSYKFIKRRFVR